MRKRYVPKTYNNGRVIRWIIGAVIMAAVAIVVLFIGLFFWLENFAVTTPDGEVRLEIPFLMGQEYPDPPPEYEYYDYYDENGED